MRPFIMVSADGEGCNSRQGRAHFVAEVNSLVAVGFPTPASSVEIIMCGA